MIAIAFSLALPPHILIPVALILVIIIAAITLAVTLRELNRMQGDDYDDRER